jgi:hypothetical protein
MITSDSHPPVQLQGLSIAGRRIIEDYTFPMPSNCSAMIDRANGQWYQTDEKLHHQSWKIHLALAILRFGILNFFAISDKPPWHMNSLLCVGGKSE